MRHLFFLVVHVEFLSGKRASMSVLGFPTCLILNFVQTCGNLTVRPPLKNNRKTCYTNAMATLIKLRCFCVSIFLFVFSAPEELYSIIQEVKYRTGLQSAKLIRQLRRRDRLCHKLQKNYDIITACLQAVSQKRRKNTQFLLCVILKKTDFELMVLQDVCFVVK